MRKTFLLYPFLLMMLAFQLHAQVPTDNLLLFYSFKGNADNVAGEDLDGVVNGATLATDRFGNANSAYSFDGVDDYIQINGNLDTNVVKQPATISFWIKSEHDSTQTILFMNDTTEVEPHYATIYIGNHATGSLTNEIITVGRIFSETEFGHIGYTTENRSELLDNGWHHVAIVHNDTVSKIYVDNSIIETTTYYGENAGGFGVAGSMPIVTLGGRFYNDNHEAFLKGDLDDFRLYNKALTASEIEALYNEENNNTSIHSIKNGTILSLYPNPSSDYININSKSNIVGFNLRIVNSVGQSVYTQKINENSFKVDISSIHNSGLYFIQLTDDNLILKETMRLVIK